MSITREEFGNNYRITDNSDELFDIYEDVLTNSIDVKNLLHEFWNRKSDACPLDAIEMENQILAWEEFVESKLKAKKGV